jgi:hypothetical protein
MPWNQVQPHPEALALLDPYLEWGMQTNFAYYFATGGAQDFFPVIIELQGISAEQFAIGKWNAPSGWQSWLRIPPMYAQPPAGLAPSSFCTANVAMPFFRELRDGASPLPKVIKRASLSLPTPSQAPRRYEPPKPRNIPPEPHLVVTGIIDDGLAFANERFRRGQQTRIEYVWNQDAPAGGVPGVLYGREILKHDIGGVPGIDTLMATARHGGPLVAEEEVYRECRHLDYNLPGHKPVAQRGSHGTHVMDIACGFDAQAAPADRPIICVQLPVATTANSSGALLAAPVLDGLRYIVDRADQLAVREGCGPLPIVVNLSYGFIAGPHDGRSVLEAAIDELVRLRRSVAPMSVVLPAGNSYLARCHARFSLARDAQLEQPLRWRIQPDDRTPSFMELWLPPRTGERARIEVRVNPPSGNTSPWIQEGQVYEWREPNDVLCKVIYFNGVAAGRTRNMVFIAVAPTATHSLTAELAPAGRWEVQVRNVGPKETFDAWIQRDDTPYGYPIRGRQSRFDDPSYGYRDDAGREIEVDAPGSYVLRAGTINALATGREPVVLGGFHRREWTPAKYSAAGPIITPPGAVVHRTGPDAMAVSEDSAALHGLLAAGTQSNSVVRINGTSVSAPQITRWIANDMAAGNAGDRGRVQAIPSNRPPWAPGAPPVPRGGNTQVEFPAVVPSGRPSEP